MKQPINAGSINVLTSTMENQSNGSKVYEEAKEAIKHFFK
jgi:hypothetical protein